MKIPYEKIGETTPECAFLTNSEGYDVATLSRIDQPDHKLSNEEWQRLVNLIDAAPALLDACKNALYIGTDEDTKADIRAEIRAVLARVEWTDCGF